MATKHRDEEEWKHAKRICRLSARQVAMARRLGMNPRKLPGLRPSPHQRWKLPVGAFIEERYWKRFGRDPRNKEPRGAGPGSRRRATPDRDASVSERIRDAAWQLSELVCYLVNLADDLQKWLTEGTVPPDVLSAVSDELRETAAALDTGATISAIPSLSLPPQRRAASSREHGPEPMIDDEIPF